jgi:hypothetical protein
MLCPSKNTIYPSQHFPFGAAFVCQARNFWTLLHRSKFPHSCKFQFNIYIWCFIKIIHHNSWLYPICQTLFPSTGPCVASDLTYNRYIVNGIMETKTDTNKYLLEIYIAQVSIHFVSDCPQPKYTVWSVWELCIWFALVSLELSLTQVMATKMWYSSGSFSINLWNRGLEWPVLLNAMTSTLTRTDMIEIHFWDYCLQKCDTV